MMSFHPNSICYTLVYIYYRGVRIHRHRLINTRARSCACVCARATIHSLCVYRWLHLYQLFNLISQRVSITLGTATAEQQRQSLIQYRNSIDYKWCTIIKFLSIYIQFRNCIIRSRICWVHFSRLMYLNRSERLLTPANFSLFIIYLIRFSEHYSSYSV